jgi:hypothetical protein
MAGSFAPAAAPVKKLNRCAIVRPAALMPLPVAVVACSGIIAAASEVDGAMERRISMPLGVVVERREIDNRWQRFAWRPVAVLPGAAPVTEWRELVRGERLVRWHAATLPLELHRTETEGYRANLSGKVPAIYVGLREQSGGEHEYAPFLVTASPYEAACFPDDIVEAVPMPDGLIAWVQGFVDRHHVDEPFQKRKRDKPKAAGFDRRRAQSEVGHG